MTGISHRQCTAFEGFELIESGDLRDVAVKTKGVLKRGEKAPVLIFDDVTSEQIELDFRGSTADLLARIDALPTNESPTDDTVINTDDSPRGRGRPRLGVVAREVTLLPRHWEWLGTQPGGASVALRKLVEEAKRANKGKDDVRQAQESAYRFLSALAGNLPGFEEATRALFKNDATRFEELIAHWPNAVRQHASKLAARSFITQE